MNEENFYMEPTSPQPQTPQPTSPQPPLSPTVVPDYPAPEQPAIRPPGTFLTVLGFILAFLLPPLGLLFSIIAKIKSSKAGVKNTMAIVGIVVGALLTIALLVFTPILLTTYNKVQSQQADSRTIDEMITLSNEVLTYTEHSFTIPQELSSLKSMPDFNEAHLVDAKNRSYAITWSPNDCFYETCKSYTISANSAAYPSEKLTLTYDTATQTTTLGDGSGETKILSQ